MTPGNAASHMLYDPTHPLQVFFGYDVSGEMVFFLITPQAPEDLPARNESIDVQLLQRHDGLHTLVFRLLKPGQDSVFRHLCWDLAESTRLCRDDALGVVTLLDRYRKWQRLLNRGRDGTLTHSQIKGLIGELLLLEQYLFVRYGTGPALKGWIGPTGADQDFRFKDSWYEVKATGTGALTIRISSMEQLDTDDAGQLCVVFLDEAGSAYPDGISLNALVARIRDSIANDVESASIFERRIEEAGYIDSREYSRDLFVLRKIRQFLVNEKFPRIRQGMLDPSIARVAYDLVIGSLTRFEISESVV